MYTNVMEIIGRFKEHNYSLKEKTIIDVETSSGELILTIYPDAKYIQFHDKFTQSGIDLPGIKNILSTVCKGWNTNHS